jgi:hypothetical protein
MGSISGPHHLTAPFIEEVSGPGGGVVIPELLKGFLQKAAADSGPWRWRGCRPARFGSVPIALGNLRLRADSGETTVYGQGGRKAS